MIVFANNFLLFACADKIHEFTYFVFTFVLSFAFMPLFFHHYNNVIVRSTSKTILFNRHHCCKSSPQTQSVTTVFFSFFACILSGGSSSLSNFSQDSKFCVIIGVLTCPGVPSFALLFYSILHSWDFNESSNKTVRGFWPYHRFFKYFRFCWLWSPS